MTITTPVAIAKKYSKASSARLDYMKTVLEDVERLQLPGDIVECGVWRGGHIMLARMVLPDRRCWLYDTFDGMTEPGEHDYKIKGDMRKSYAKIKRMSVAPLDGVVADFKKEGLYDENKLKFVVGDVRKTLNEEVNLPNEIAVLRLDTDWYDSTKKELEVLWPRLLVGGHLIIDDWGHWHGSRKAAKEYLEVHQPDYWRHLWQVDYAAVALVKQA